MGYTFGSKKDDPYDVHVMRSLSKQFRDMEDYLIMETKDMEIESVVDVGTGLKGAVAQYYYEKIHKITLGYVVDVWVLKEMPPLWKPLKIDALDLLEHIAPKSVDVVQAFGFMEHLLKDDGYKFIEIAETIAKKFIIFSAATCIHSRDDQECGSEDEADYKVKRDGNPYHRYNSSWQWDEFEALGYTSNWEDARDKNSFKTEAIAWNHLSD